jgi:hypothetical protein
LAENPIKKSVKNLNPSEPIQHPKKPIDSKKLQFILHKTIPKDKSNIIHDQYRTPETSNPIQQIGRKSLIEQQSLQIGLDQLQTEHLVYLKSEGIVC